MAPRYVSVATADGDGPFDGVIRKLIQQVEPRSLMFKCLMHLSWVVAVALLILQAANSLQRPFFYNDAYCICCHLSFKHAVHHLALIQAGCNFMCKEK